MNDFTKEELQIIRYLINNLDEKMLTWNDDVILVQSKIQSMIDNYKPTTTIETKLQDNEWG